MHFLRHQTKNAADVITHGFLHWLPTAVITLVAFMTIYATVQQSYRQGANDPQVQIAEDAVLKLGASAPVAEIVPTAQVDLRRSLDTWITIADTNGQVVASSAGTLNGVDHPVPPKGVLENAKLHGQNRITWQPQVGIRSAIVVESIDSGSRYVIVGRSLREVEKRENQLELMVFAGLVVALLGSLVASITAAWMKEFSEAK